jgi:cytidylate kinase
MKNLVIGIEGLVGAGKTSICRELIKRIPNTILINGGNIYRAIVAMKIKNGSKLSELKTNASNIDMKDLMDLLEIEIKIENNETVLYYKNQKLDEEYLQSKEISLAVSSLGGRTNEDKLFDFARGIIKEFSQKYNIILSGRGIMKIYPECDYHLFITASLDARVDRKASQYGDKVKDEVRANIIKRDELQKEVGYYDLSEKTKVIDVTDCKNIEESTDKVLETLGFYNTLNV